MAWVKIPPENHPLFLAALPRDPRVTTMRMFGAVVAKANGYLFGGLFARSVLVRLSPADQQVALALDGTAPFDPMGNGRVMRNTLLLPEDVLDDASELRTWLARALAYTLTLPPKPAAGAKRGPARAASAPPAAKGRTRSRTGAKGQATTDRAPQRTANGKPARREPRSAKRGG